MAADLIPAHNADDDLLIANPDGRVKLVWFVDYSDHYTRRVRDMLARPVDRFREADLAIYTRVICSEDPADDEYWAARAAIAADAQNRYAEMNEALFDSEPHFTKESVMAIAATLGLDAEQFESDLSSEKTDARLERFHTSFQASNIVQMPACFIDGLAYNGVWDDVDLMRAIEKPLGYRIEVASLRFISWAASAGAVMILATLAALILSNIGFHDAYLHFIEAPSGIVFRDWSLILPLEVWVNDALMALFFLLVGMEIKHEVLDGELSSVKSAAVPIAAAIGGMAVPALIYLAFNAGLPTAQGWGIPMATDIAFTLGILMILGDRVPASLKVFVSALAIVDDLGAIIVIALFYGHGFDVAAFSWAVGIFLFMILLNYWDIYNRIPYMIAAVLLWYFVHESGLHATLAGVLTALAIPSRPSARTESVAIHSQSLIGREVSRDQGELSDRAILMLNHAVSRLRGSSFSLQHNLELMCNYFILPVFAFFNTGILIFGSSFSLAQPEVLGVIGGLVIGKPLGILLAVWLVLRLGIGKLSAEIHRDQLAGAACLCGIGFTMSIFIATSSFSGEALGTVKLAILIASLLAGVIGAWILMRADHHVIDTHASKDGAAAIS